MRVTNSRYFVVKIKAQIHVDNQLNKTTIMYVRSLKIIFKIVKLIKIIIKLFSLLTFN
jgi:hypothetical protein